MTYLVSASAFRLGFSISWSVINSPLYFDKGYRLSIMLNCYLRGLLKMFRIKLVKWFFNVEARNIRLVVIILYKTNYYYNKIRYRKKKFKFSYWNKIYFDRDTWGSFLEKKNFYRFNNSLIFTSSVRFFTTEKNNIFELLCLLISDRFICLVIIILGLYFFNYLRKNGYLINFLIYLERLSIFLNKLPNSIKNNVLTFFSDYYIYIYNKYFSKINFLFFLKNKIFTLINYLKKKKLFIKITYYLKNNRIILWYQNYINQDLPKNFKSSVIFKNIMLQNDKINNYLITNVYNILKINLYTNIEGHQKFLLLNETSDITRCHRFSIRLFIFTVTQYFLLIYILLRISSYYQKLNLIFTFKKFGFNLFLKNFIILRLIFFFLSFISNISRIILHIIFSILIDISKIIIIYITPKHILLQSEYYYLSTERKFDKIFENINLNTIISTIQYVTFMRELKCKVIMSKIDCILLNLEKLKIGDDNFLDIENYSLIDNVLIRESDDIYKNYSYFKNKDIENELKNFKEYEILSNKEKVLILEKFKYYNVLKYYLEDKLIDKYAKNVWYNDSDFRFRRFWFYFKQFFEYNNNDYIINNNFFNKEIKNDEVFDNYFKKINNNIVKYKDIQKPKKKLNYYSFLSNIENNIVHNKTIFRVFKRTMFYNRKFISDVHNNYLNFSTRNNTLIHPAFNIIKLKFTTNKGETDEYEIILGLTSNKQPYYCSFARYQMIPEVLVDTRTIKNTAQYVGNNLIMYPKKTLEIAKTYNIIKSKHELFQQQSSAIAKHVFEKK